MLLQHKDESTDSSFFYYFKLGVIVLKNIDVLQVVIPLIQNYMFDVYAVETTDTDVIIKIDVVNVTEAPRF